MRKLITSVALCAFAFANGAYAAGLAPESFNKMYSLAHSGDIYGLREAIHRGLYIDSPNQNGNTGLCVAIYRGDQRAYNTFRAAGANPRHPCTSVIPAAQYNSFMSSGAVVASPNTVPALTYTPIHTGFLYSPRFWTYVGLGAIAIAALAFSGGGGGHKKSSPEPEPEKVDEGLAKLSGTYVVTNRTDEETGEKLPDEDLITTNVSGKDSSKYTITSDDGFSYKEDYADYFSQKNNYRALTNPLQQADRFLVSYKFSDGVLVKTSGQALGFVNLGEIGLAVYGWGKDGVLTKYDASSSFSVESTNAAYGIVAGNLATATLGGMGTIDVQADGDYYWSSAVGMYADTGALIRNKGTINGSSNGDGTAVGMMTMQVIDHHLKKKPSGYGEVITRAVNDGTITMEGKNIVAMGGYMAEPVKGSRSKFDKATLVNNNKINIKSTGTKNELIGDKNTEEASGYRGAVGMRADAVTTATNMGQIALSGGSSSESGGSGSRDSKEGNMAGMMVVHGGTIVNGYKDYISGKGSDFDPKGIIIVGGTDGIIDDRGNIDIKKIDPTPGYGMVSLAGGLLLKNNPVNNLINYGQIYVLSDGSSAIYVNHYSNVTMGNGSYIYLSRTGTEGKGQTVIENASDREISGTSSGDKIETRGKIEIINTPKKERSDNNPTLTKDVESYVFKGLFKHVYNYADIVFGDPNFMSESITRSEAIFLYDYDNFSGVLHNYGAIEWNSALSAYNETTREGYTNNYLLNGKNYYQETNGSEAGSLTVNTLLMYSKPTAMVAPEILPIDSILYVDGSEIGNTYSVVGKFEYTNNDTKYTKNEGSEEEPDYPYDYGGHPVLIEAEDLDKLTSSADLILHQVAKNTKDPHISAGDDGDQIIAAIKATDVDNIISSSNIEVTDASTISSHHVHGIYAINTDNYSDMTIKNSGNITVVPTSGASIEYAAIRAIAGNGSDLKTLTINNSGDITAPIGIFATYITQDTPNDYLDYKITNTGTINIQGVSRDDGITINSGRNADIINKGDILGALSGIRAYEMAGEIKIQNYATVNTNVGGNGAGIYTSNYGTSTTSDNPGKTTIDNYGEIIAYRRGIQSYGGDITVNNHQDASITSSSGDGIRVEPLDDNPLKDANITNDGDISAYTAGIYVINASGDVNIENNGTVETSSTSGMVYSIYASQVEGDVHIVNNKDIKSSGNLTSGIYDYANNSSLIENNGNINIQSTNIGFGIFSTSADTHISNTGSIVSTGTRDMGVFYNAVGDFSLCNGGTFDANGNCIKEDSSAIISSGSYYAVNTGSASTANIYNWGNITSGNSSGIYIPTYTQEANIYNYDSGNITGKIGIESYIYDFDQADISIYNKGNIGNSDTVTGIKLSGGYIYNGVDNPDGDEINKDALITGADYGIYSTDGYDDLYVKNYAKINGNQAIYFDTFDGQQYNSNILNIYNAKDAVIEGETDAIKAFTYGADETVTIYNNGLITASTYGIDVSNGAETGKIKITNGADGIISANYAIFINDEKNTGNPDEDDPSENKGSLELINYGTITSNSGSGVYFSGNSIDVQNNGGSIYGDYGIYADLTGVSGTKIENSGTIHGTEGGISLGLTGYSEETDIISNSGTISSGDGDAVNITIRADNGPNYLYITNDASGEISSDNESALHLDSNDTIIKVTNNGIISADNGYAVFAKDTAEIVPQSITVINGTDDSYSGATISGKDPIYIAEDNTADISIVNRGSITQTTNSDNAAITIKDGRDVSISNNSTGVISGYYDGTDYSPAISISGISRKAEITNATTGIINGDIKIEGDYNITSPLSSSDVPGVITVRNNNPDSVVNVLYDDTFNIKTNYAAAMNVYGNVDAHNAGTINVGSSSQSVYNAHGMYAGNGARIYNDSGAVINVYANTNGIEPSGLSVGDNSYGENAGTINVYGNGAFSGIWANSGSEVKNIGKIYINGNNNRAINIRDTGSRAINEGELLLLQSAEALNGILVEEGATGTNASEGIILVGKSNSSALESSNGIYVSSGKGYNSGTITVYGTHTSSDITKLNTGMHANGENSEITNNKDGTIKVYNRYNVGMYAGGKAKSYNEGTIEINSNLGSALPQFQESCGMYATGSNSQANNMATGIINVNQNNSLIVNNNSGMKAKSSATAVNYGTINAKWIVSDENKSPDMLYLTNYGMYASGGTVVNVGDIELDGMTVGMYADNTAGSKAVNYGSIYVGNDAIGMLVGGENATIINNGYIEASGAKAYAVAAVTVNGGVLPNKYSVNGTVINNGVINITNSATGDDKSYLFVALNKDRRVDIGSNNVSETKVYSARNPLQYFTFDAQAPNNYSNYTQNQASPTQVKNAKISAYERALTVATTYGLDTAEIYKNLCALDPSHYGCPVSTPSGAPAANTMSLGAGKTLMLSSAPRALTATAPVTATSDTDTNEGEDNTLVAENEEDDLEFSTTDDTPAPATLGKSAKVVSLSGGSTFVNNGLVLSDEDIDFDEWAEDDESSVQVSRSGTFAARSLKGTVVATADIVTSETNENEYETEGSFIGDTEELTVESGSYLFSASLANTGGAVAGIRMTMKDFEDVKGAKGAADFLDENYNNGNRVDMFNRIKAASNQAAYEKVVNEELGLDFIPTLAKQNIEFVRDTSGQMTDSIFENIDSATRREFITGIDYYHHRNSSYEGVMSYDSDGMNVYGVYDEDLTADTSVGLGFAIGTNRSEYDDDSTARQTTAQVYVPVSFAPKEFSFVSMPRFGAGVGKYKRRVADDSTHQADLTTYYYGISNQARKKFEFGGIDVEPTAEFNVLGMYMDKIKERENLYVKSQNDVSVEGGLGLYIGKTVEFANSALLKLRLGGTYYRELADPYRNTKAGFVDADGTYEIKGYNAKHDRGVVSLKADYNFALFDLYIKASEYIESNSNFAIQAGMKYSF